MARVRACLGLPALLGAAWVGTLGCDTVDLGPPPADVNLCHPSQLFFVQQIWPNFLAKDYGGKRCGDARCHDASSGRQLVLPPPTSPAPSGLPLPDDWAALYKSTIEQMQCTDVKSSPLLTHPDGEVTHGGGALIAPDGPEVTLVTMWVSSP
jgi:hypothetical protein